MTVARFPVERTRPRQFVTLEQLMCRFGFGERWWRYRVREGLPCKKWGGQLRFDPDEVERWLEARRDG